RRYDWIFQWHRFIQVLAEGHTPEAFFAHLLSSQRMASETKHQYQAELDDSLNHASLGVHGIHLEVDHIHESALQARTRAHRTCRTAQVTRAQCQQTRHLRARMRQGLHRSGGWGQTSPEEPPSVSWRQPGADRDGTPGQLFPRAHGTSDTPASAPPTGKGDSSTEALTSAC